MPWIYFLAASVGILVATGIAALIQTKETRKQISDQMMLDTDDVIAVETKPEAKDHQPAAMVSVS